MVVAELTYDQYTIVANERNWPTSNEAHEAYSTYCCNDTTTIPPEFNEIVLTKDDCEIFPCTSSSNESIYLFLQNLEYCPAELTTTPLPDDQTTTIVQSTPVQTSPKSSATTDKMSTTERASSTMTTQKSDTTDVKTTQHVSPKSASTSYATDTPLQETTKSIQIETSTSSTSATSTSTTVKPRTTSEASEISTTTEASKLIPISKPSDQTKDYAATSASSIPETTPVATEPTLSPTLKVSTSIKPIKDTLETESISTSMPKETTTSGSSTDVSSSSSQSSTTSEKTNVPSTKSTSATPSTAKPTTTSDKTTPTTSSSHPSTPAKTTTISSSKSTSSTTIPKTKSTVLSSPTSSTTSTTTKKVAPTVPKTSLKTTKSMPTTTLPSTTPEKTSTTTNKPTTVTPLSTIDSSGALHTSTRIQSTVRVPSTTPDSTSTDAPSATQSELTTTTEGTTSSSVKKTDTSTSSSVASTQQQTQTVISTQLPAQTSSSSGESLTVRETTTTSSFTVTSKSSYGQTTTAIDSTTSTTMTSTIGNTETEIPTVSVTEVKTTTPQPTTEKSLDESTATTTGAPKTSDVHVTTTSAATVTIVPTTSTDSNVKTSLITEESSTTSAFSSPELPEDTSTLTQTEYMPAKTSTTQKSTTVEMPFTSTTATTKHATDSPSSISITASITTSTKVLGNGGSTSEAESTVEIATPTTALKTTPKLEETTSTKSSAPSTTDQSSTTVPTTTTQKGSTENANQETSLPVKEITFTTTAPEAQQSTTGKTRKPDSFETTVHSTTATPTTPETTTTKKSTKAPTTTSDTRTKSSPSTEPTTESTSDPSASPSSSSSASTIKGTTSTTQSAACKNACPSDFIEGDNACFKLLQPNTTHGWQFKDFQNACDSQNGIIASYVDFGYAKNVKLFMDMSQHSQSFLVLTNTVPTKKYRSTKAVLAIDAARLNMVKVPITAFSIGEKFTNVSAICRVGKYCETYTCPIIEYFFPNTSQYLEAAVPSTTVFKASESLTVQCTVAPKRSFKVKCDPRGYLTPDSSMIKCGNEDIIESEADGVVSSCEQCDKFQTTSCDNLGNGSYYCNCKELFFGKTCRYPLNACQNFTCENEGSCMNRFTYAYCKCKTAYFGEHCEHNFYDSYEAWAMRMMVNIAAFAVIVEHAVREHKRATPSMNGKIGSLPTEICRTMTNILGALAFTLGIMLEFPENDSPAQMSSCAYYFSFMITLVFFVLTAMIGESIISLGVIQNQTTNQFRGQFRRRRNCVKPGKFYFFLFGFGFLAPVVLWQFSQYMVTPRSCVGIIPWNNFTPEMNYAGVALLSILGIYAFTGTGLAILARFWINHQAYATRRRYDCDYQDPFAYGKEVLPVEMNVRYCLLPIRPTLFAICWVSFIVAAEQMTWWATWTATGCSCVYSVVSMAQNYTALADGLDTTIVFLMKWTPERWAPAFNYITLRTRDDHAQVWNYQEYLWTQHKKLKGGPAIRYPIPFDQNVEYHLRTSNPNVLNPAAIYKLIPPGLQYFVVRKWKRIYLKNRAAGKRPWKAIREVWRDVHDKRPATFDITPQSFVALFKNFKRNMAHWDRFDHNDPIGKKIYERGAETLSIMPTYKIETAETWKTNSTKQTATYFRGDPLLDFDAQQAAYDYLEKVCKSISAEDMEKEEFETAEFVENCPDLCGRHRDVLTAQVVNNHRWTLHDFLLDELRPNFIGPKSYENQLAPGVTYLDDTAYYWMKIGTESWQRLEIKAKYETMNEAVHEEYNLWKSFLPWNWFKTWEAECYEPAPVDPLDFPNELNIDEAENFGPIPEDVLDFPNELNNENGGKGSDNVEQ